MVWISSRGGEAHGLACKVLDSSQTQPWHKMRPQAKALNSLSLISCKMIISITDDLSDVGRIKETEFEMASGQYIAQFTHSTDAS